jgi:autotransporter-associated beta strand protein
MPASETLGGLSSTGGGGIVENESGSAGIGTLILNVASGSQTYSGILRDGNGVGTDGTLALTKEGVGTQVLSGTNTYTGATTVTAGTLIVNGDQTAATGNVAVDSGATLGGVGTIGGDTSITGNLRVGIDTAAGTTGTLNFSSEDLSLNSGSSWLVDIVGADADSLAAINVFTINAAANLAFNFSAPTQSSYTIASYSSRSGFFNGLADGADVGFGYTINYGANQITLTAVPEPGTLGVLGLGLGGYLVRRIRRRNRKTACPTE